MSKPGLYCMAHLNVLRWSKFFGGPRDRGSPMIARRISAALLALAISCGQALAWGYQGHEIVGSIADHLLNDHAKQEVRNILRFELRVAAPWPDCVRSVVRQEDGSFKYKPTLPVYRIPCTPFETPEETARMEDYVSRNWSNCTYEAGHGCHETYHFADVTIQHDRYDQAYAGTSNHDVVSAINAAIMVLQDQQAPSPFSIRDKKEALFLLAHFVGDSHQPLHVGAIYLDPAGRPVNPDHGGSVDPQTQTAGGNFIFEHVDQNCKGTNLHSDWDAIPKSLGTSADPAMVDKARAVPPTSGPVADFAAIWASDTVLASHSAFKGLAFTAACKGHWLVHFKNHKTYLTNENKLKRDQLAKGGARLAQLLNTIWP